MPLGQVTITSTGVTQRFTTNPQRCMQLQIQNNGVAVMRVGDDPTVSASKGLKLQPGGADNSGAFTSGATTLSSWYVNGTAGDVIDYQYTPEL